MTNPHAERDFMQQWLPRHAEDAERVVMNPFEGIGLHENARHKVSRRTISLEISLLLPIHVHMHHKKSKPG
jgi:hypothetical protein